MFNSYIKLPEGKWMDELMEGKPSSKPPISLGFLLVREQWLLKYQSSIHELRVFFTLTSPTGTPLFGVGRFQRTPMFARIRTLFPCHFHFDWLKILNQQLIARNRVTLSVSVGMIHILNKYYQLVVEHLQHSMTEWYITGLFTYNSSY